MSRYAIVVHGGCGRWPREQHRAALAGVREALAAGQAALASGGSAIDAVCAAVVVMEDNPIFNAGTGSALNRDGVAEMDASVMEGHSLRCGGVAAIQRVRNPVLVARKVMEETEHVLLSGAGAQSFARRQGFADYDPLTRQSLDRYRLALSEKGRTLPHDTVGAVARDARGRLAAATSTGGTLLKLPGRIGDSPIPGAGNYATRYGAASATGRGERMLRIVATKIVCDLIAQGDTAKSSASRVMAMLTKGSPSDAGVVAIDAKGGIGVAHRGGTMPHAYVGGSCRVVARMRAP